MKDQLQDMLEEMFGKGAVHVETIKVPHGSTIEAEVAKRRDPNWCEECQEVHEGRDEQGTMAEQKLESRAKALKAVRMHQARLLEALDVLKALEKSMMKPDSERTAGTTIGDLVMLMKLRSLGE